MIEQKSHLPSDYRKNHEPSGLFASRSEYLDHELTILAPRLWRLILPGWDFRFEIEDFVPAIPRTIGKIIMTTAIVKAFIAGYGLDPNFISDNVRFEILITPLLFVFLI
jgi:hypothetical protein